MSTEIRPWLPALGRAPARLTAPGALWENVAVLAAALLSVWLVARFVDRRRLSSRRRPDPSCRWDRPPGRSTPCHRSKLMPKYAALIYRVEADQAEQGSPESQQLYQAWGAFNQAIAQSGVMKDGKGLLPTPTATTVRVRDGKTVLTDGPFAETREQLGGMLVFECGDLDEAIHWASQIPDASRGGCVELRPLWEM
jgi:hypothetical protein